MSFLAENNYILNPMIIPVQHLIVKLKQTPHAEAYSLYICTTKRQIR